MAKLKCPCCDREPKDIAEYVEGAQADEVTPEQFAWADGTYSARHQLFTCTSCYIKIGMPLNHDLFEAYDVYTRQTWEAR